MASKIPYLIKSIRLNNGVRSNRLLSLLSAFNPQQNGGREVITGAKLRCFYSSSAVKTSELGSDELHDDIKAAEKDTALHTALSQLVGEFDGESMLFLQRFFRARVKPVVSTGSLKLDLALGIGGLPKGRVVEIYGHEGSGKTTLALHIIKEAQKLGGNCAYLDVENALDPLLMESIGVISENLLYSQPDSAENLLSIVDTLVKSGSVDVIVVDSVAALIPESEIKSPIGNVTGTQSKMMTQALRKIHYSLCRSETVIIFINQVRYVKVGQGIKCWKEVTCGGNALPFYSAVRMRIARKGLIKTDEEVIGLGICVEVIKNKLAPAMKKADLEIQFGRGIATASEVLELACDHKVVIKEGSSYFIDGEVLNSKERAENYLVENGGVRDKLVKSLRSKLFEKDGSPEDS